MFKRGRRFMTVLFTIVLILAGIIGIGVSILKGQEWAKIDDDVGMVIMVAGIAGTVFVILLFAMLIEASLNLARLNDNVVAGFTEIFEKMNKESKRLLEIKDDVASTFIKCRHIKDDVSGIAAFLTKTADGEIKPKVTNNTIINDISATMGNMTDEQFCSAEAVYNSDSSKKYE